MTQEQGQTIAEWINQNAERYWLSAGGPLASRSNGGAEVIFVDDPQMPGLIPLAKKTDPDRIVLFRSHIQIRSDLVATEGSPASEVWRYLWNSGIGQADLFISHPVREFVPKDVPPSKVGYMPATTDW
jgi:alpha,alpha-trehalose phosphorylase (configuration-retaining)